MPRYYDNEQVRQREHDRLDTAMTGGHEDLTSFGSLDLLTRTPNIQVKRSRLRRRKQVFMYYDEDEQYEIKRVSDIRANDYVFAERANNSADDVDMKAVYKACANALDSGMFIFERGEFDCANKFLQSANLYDGNKPALDPDRLFPKYFRRESPIKGRVTFERVFVGEHLGGTRRIIVINLDTDEDLSQAIRHKSIIYIGGDHSQEELGFPQHNVTGSPIMEDGFQRSTRGQKNSASVCWHEDEEIYRARHMLENVQTSSPLTNTWTAFGTRGPNIGMLMAKDGRYVYWPTECEPESGHVISRLAMNEVPFSSFDSEACFKRSYTDIEIENLVEGAWVMRREWLNNDELKEELPPCLFTFLRSGFFRLEPRLIKIDQPRLASRLRRLIRSLKAMTIPSRIGLGFYDTEESDVYECKLSDVARRVGTTVDALAALIAEACVGCTFFRGLVGYAGKRCTGPLRITDATPVGEWMIGRLYDTGAGLLYNDCSGTFFTLRTIDCVSFLGVCEEGRILERRSPLLGNMLHGEASLWDSQPNSVRL